MKEVIPVFPLQMVVFPGEVISLHIFEPRYKALIKDCKELPTTFGLTPILDGKIMEYGTEIQLTEIVRAYDDGRFDIRCMGVQPYKQGQFYRVLGEKLYPGAEIERINMVIKGDVGLNRRIIGFIEKLYAYMGINKSLPDETTEGLTFKIGHHLGLHREQECFLLGLPTERKRQKYVLGHLAKFVPTVLEQDEMRKRIQMNGHFRNLQSPDF